MPFQGFTHDDFAVFQIEGLEPRMDALIARVRPKLNELGNELAPVLSALCGEEMFPHVAKHARRTVHAPNDTWVAWGPNKRGYKALPHFQVGMFYSHLFVVFAIIYESSNKGSSRMHWRSNLQLSAPGFREAISGRPTTWILRESGNQTWTTYSSPSLPAS